VNSVSARVLAKALWHNHVITVLDLSSLGLSDHAGSYIARMLNRNNTLVKLDLADNQLGPRTCHVRETKSPFVLACPNQQGNAAGLSICALLLELQAFGESLVRNSSLQHLNLDSNPLTGSDGDIDGIRHLAAALEQNATLTSLNLHRCCLKDKGGRAISAALDNNHTLLFVDVANNGVELQEERNIADKLAMNTQR
jgi:hypothetical protein